MLATADSMAHLLTDFYVHFIWAKGDKELAEVKELMLKKLERDFHAKILFDDARERCRGDYEPLKHLFSR